MVFGSRPKNNVLSCIECGSCAYVCPAHIPLVQYIQRVKQAIALAKKGEVKEMSKLTISTAPHFHSGNTVSAAMRDVLLALSPALVAAIYFFGFGAIKVIFTCIIVAMFSEFLAQKIRGQAITLNDYSAVVTGLLLAFCLPAGLPCWMAAIGALIAIIVGKQLFGGLGNNLFNPALVGRAVLLASGQQL